MITIKHSGNFRNTERFFANAKKLQIYNILSKYGAKGVNALALATPKDTGETAASWSYGIEITDLGCQISWFNSHEENSGIMPAILIQYGHATRNGGYVQGFDYINPAMTPIFNDIAMEIWKEVSKL